METNFFRRQVRPKRLGVSDSAQMSVDHGLFIIRTLNWSISIEKAWFCILEVLVHLVSSCWHHLPVEVVVPGPDFKMQIQTIVSKGLIELLYPIMDHN